MTYFIALLIFVLAYVVIKFLLEKVESLKGIAEVLAIVLGVLVALLYIGALG